MKDLVKLVKRVKDNPEYGWSKFRTKALYYWGNKKYTLTELAEIRGMSWQGLRDRIYSFGVEEAMKPLTPPREDDWENS